MLSWELYGLSVRYAHQDNSNLVVLVNKLSSRSWDSTLLSSSLAVDVLSLLTPHRSFVVSGMVAISIRRSIVSWLVSLACCVYGPACPSIRVLSFIQDAFLPVSMRDWGPITDLVTGWFVLLIDDKNKFVLFSLYRSLINHLSQL